MLFIHLEPSESRRIHDAMHLESPRIPERLTELRLGKEVIQIWATGKEASSLRSDSDDNASHTLPTPSTSRSESERKVEAETEKRQMNRMDQSNSGEIHGF